METDYYLTRDGEVEPLQWRIRNFNDAVCPHEGEKIPFY
jgi:hypothetical protein